MKLDRVWAPTIGKKQGAVNLPLRARITTRLWVAPMNANILGPSWSRHPSLCLHYLPVVAILCNLEFPQFGQDKVL